MKPRRVGRWSRLGGSYLGVLWLTLAAAPAGAHELGTVRTFATLHRGGTYSVEVLIDREHLPPGFARSAAPASRPVAGLAAGLTASPAGRVVGEVAAHSRVFFDGRPVESRAAWTNPDPEAREPVLRLTGTIPAGASTFSWSNTLHVGTYLLTVATEGRSEPQRQWVEGGETSQAVPLAAAVRPPTRLQVARQYLALGYTHILPRGTDHILFVLGIFLLSTRMKPVLLQVTAFTAAHTITLALTIYGVVSLPSSVVEPLIAASIVYVAVENVVHPELSPWRVALVFGFGLLHGMGFAGVLSQLGLPRSEFLPALLSFNAGVELGQLSVILVAFALLGLPFRREAWYRRRVVVPASVAIAAVGLVWAIERVLPALT